MTRLSLHHASALHVPVNEFIDACERAGVEQVGLLRGYTGDVKATAARLSDAGIKVTSYSPVGFWASGRDASGVPHDLAKNLRVLDDAAALGASVAFAIAGPADHTAEHPSAHDRMVEGLAELAPHAADRGITLALEPLHPMFCADRSVLCTLRQALQVVQQVRASSVGLNLDVYHLWWDPDLEQLISDSSGLISMVQLSDWRAPVGPDPLFSRGLPGTGVVSFRTLLGAIAAAGYAGPLEIEVLSDQLSRRTAHQVVDDLKESYAHAIAPLLCAEADRS